MNTDKQSRNTEGLDPWPPGRSGNLKGRPKKSMCYSDTARELMAAQEIDVSWTVDGKAKTLKVTSNRNMYYGIVAAQIMEALKGNVQAAKELIDRTEGRARQTISLQDNKPRVVLYLPDNGRGVRSVG